MSVVASKLSRFVLGPLTGALLGLGLLLGGCVDAGPDIEEELDAEQVGELNDALLAGEIELEDVDGDGDIDADDLEELLLDLQAAKRSKPGDESSLGAPGEGNDPSPQPWQPDGDPDADTDAPVHVF